MRLLLVCALVATASLAKDSLRWNSEPSPSVEKYDSFKTGFEYRYNLEAQIANGLPVPGSQQSIARSQTLVSLTFPESEIAHLRIEKIRVGSAQKEITEPKTIQPFELFDEIELSEEQHRQLRLPVRFRYENGLISEIEFDREDLAWSTNIKRVVLNMLQVNLSQKNLHETRYQRESLEETKTVFTAPERTLEGECDVVYTMLPTGEKKTEELRVTKSINFEKCANRVGMRYNFRFGDECPSCENKFTGEERNIESSTVFNYRILGSSSRFLIKEVELRSVYSYAPLNEKETFFTTVMSGNLRLIQVTKEEKTIPAPKSDKKETIVYDLEWEKNEEKFLATGEESLLRNSPYPEMKNKPEMASRLIKSLIVKMESEEKGVELSATHEMARLVRVLRMSTKDEIRRMNKEIVESESHDEKIRVQMRDLFNDALALAGTYNTVEHLVEKMKKKEVSPVKAAIIFKHLTNIRVPSEKIVDSLVSLCHYQKNQPMERQSCWLTVGSIVNGMCGEHRDRLALDSEEKVCPRSLKEKYVKDMFELFTESETRYEKILALKTIANSGMDLIVFPLEKIIKDETEEKTVRIQAIDALRKLRTVMPRKIHTILMPLFKNIREQPEIRVAAFHQIMQTIPERVVIDQITSQLEKEPLHQVHSFVYSALEQLSTSEIPCEKRMAEDIKSSLRLARVQPRKMFDSRFKHYNVYSDEYKTGASLNWAALFSNDSVLPKELMTTLETTFAGQWNKYLAQVGFSQNNIDQVIYKLVQKIEENGLEEVLVRGKRSSSTFRPAELLRGLFNKLSIKSRKQVEQDPHALVYFRYRDMDFALLPIDEEVIPDIVKTVLRNGRIELGELEQILAKGFRFNTVFSTFIYERNRMIVTSMGAPLVFSSKMPTIVKMDGLLQVELDPKNGKTIDGARLRLAAKPSVSSTHITKVDFVSPIVNFGVKLLHSAQANVPVDMTLEMNWENKWEMKSTLALPKDNRRLIQLQTRPTTFVRVWPKETRVYVEPKEKTIYVEQLETLVHKMDKTIFEKATGMKINVVGHIHGHIFESGMERLPSALLIGENNVEVTFEKTEETPKEYVIKMEVENFNEESRMERPTLEKFFEKDNEEYFETEEHEEYPENEKERRGAFNKYVKEYKTNKGYSHRLFAKIHSVGARTERKAEMELRSVCDEKMRHCKVELKGERTPVTEEERRNWKIESELEVLYPEMPETLEELLNQKHRETVASVEARWGSDDKKNTLKLKLQGEQNKEQKKWIKRALEQKERKSEERLTALEEYSRLVEASMLNQYKIVAKYEIECPVVRSVIEKIYSIAKVNTPFLSTDIEYVKNEPRMLRVVLTVEPETRQYVNLTIESPLEKVVLRDIRLPYPLRLVNIRRQSVSPIRSLSTLGSSLLEETKSVCVVESRKVNSFDDVIYRTPLTTCYSVLAKDCSSEQPEFAVLMKKVEKRGEEKKMKIISKDTVIELEKISKRDEIKITVNGEEMEEVERLYKIRVFKTGEIVTVELEDVKVEFDGYTAQIKMSEYYKNKQCGICGHFDGEKKSEFRRADNEETEDIEEFHRSFLVKNDECEIEEEELKEKKNYRIESEESSSEEESIFEKSWEKKTKKINHLPRYEKDSEIVEPVEKTRVVEYSNRVCFSKQPVPECPRKTFENDEEMKEMKVKFACLLRSSPQASRLLREARTEIVDIDELPESFVETLFVPKTCTVY